MEDGCRPAPASTLSPEERLWGLASLWSEIKYNYPMWHRHPDLDWDAAYRARIAPALAEQSDADYYRLLTGFAALVRDSHVCAWPPPALAQRECAPAVGLWPLRERFVVIRVAEQLSIEAALALGDELVLVDGVPVATYAAERLAPYLCSPTPQNLALQVAWCLLWGAAGSSVEVGLRRPDGAEYRCSLCRTPAEEGAAWLRYLPLAGDRQVSSRELGEGLGYLALPGFGQPEVVEQFDQALAALGPLRGLVIDLRMNGGGNSGFGDAITGRLIAEPLPGTRERRLRYSPALRSWGMGDGGRGIEWEELQMGPLQPQGPVSFHGPLVLLTSPATHSAAEDFAAPLQVGGRARLIGEATAGSTGNPLAFPLPGGGGFRVCTRYQLLPDGREFVGVGLQPDIEICPTPADVAAARDPVLERAVRELGGQALP